ncbi:MAG TPA: ATP-binding protein [Burkholderiales bacterium]|nr:ATP-binding protein [Burkholderiales bacterium]
MPIGLFAAGLLYLHWQAQEEQRERAQIESARLLAVAVDNALDSTIQRASIFARLWAASRVDDATLHAQARQAIASNPDWDNLLAFRVDGTTVFRADHAYGDKVPPMRMFDLWRPVYEQRQPVVSNVFDSPVRGMKVLSVGVPVVRGETVTHILVVSLKLSWFDELLRRQGLPEGGVGGIFDRNWKFVARSHEGDQRRGSDPAEALLRDMRATPEGIGKYNSLNGLQVYTSWAPTRHGWHTAFATPAAPVDGAFRNHLVLFVLAWLAVVVGGIAYAVYKGRHIAGSLASLEAQAGQLAGGQRLLEVGGSGVSEIDRAYEALEKASLLLHHTQYQRDLSLEQEREARAAAEAANRAKDEFLAMLGHELRNPLAAISYAASVVKSEQHTREQLEYAGNTIARQTQHLKRLIDDLLDVGRVMTGKIILERDALDLAATARHVAGVLAAGGRFAQRHLEVDASPTWVLGDATRLEQIIGNLLSNAATYTSPGGRIRLHVSLKGEQAVIEVSDDGRGIAPEQLPRVFDLFYQADQTSDRATGGLGIGLTLVQRLVTLHGGTVSAHSDGKGKGATFTVRLRAIAARADPAVEAQPAAGGQPQTVLVIEDNPDARETLRMALELHKHKVLLAGDGPGGLALAERHRPSVAVVDIGLPGMSGHEVARLMRERLGTETLLIALTGFGGTAEEHRAREAGFDRHLTKPVDILELIAVIDPARAGTRTAGVSSKAA